MGQTWKAGEALLVTLTVVLGGCGGGTSVVMVPDGHMPDSDGRALEVTPLFPDLSADPGGGDLVLVPPEAVTDWQAEVQPGGLGYPCEDNAGCLSGYCVDSPTGKVCSTTCNEDCPDGWECVQVSVRPDVTYICVPLFANLCRPCVDHSDCAGGFLPVPEGRCVQLGDSGTFCGGNCNPDGNECPSDFVCMQVADIRGQGAFQCVPADGSCECTEKFVTQSAAGRCFSANEFGKCPGLQQCTAEGLSPCDASAPSAEICNGQDDDCNGKVDDSVTAVPCVNLNQYGVCQGEEVCVDGKPQCAAPVPAADICDGVDNDCDGTTDFMFPDNDQDGVADCVDEDDDGDDVLDGADNCPKAYNPDQLDTNENDKGDACDPDCDGDGLPNASDNCPCLANPDQSNSDMDLEGDACDSDDDNDGIWDGDDNCPTIPNADQLDSDCTGPDGTGDACDDDDDGDGILDAQDNCPKVCNLDQDDCEGDKKGDACDSDDDNDGVLDEADCAPCDATIHPGIPEVCNGKDDDCSGQIDDEGAGGCTTFYFDQDADGVGTTDQKCLCVPVGLYTAVAKGDCNDEDPTVHPGEEEKCNDVDDNCDGQVDPVGTMGCINYYLDADADGFGVEPPKCLCKPGDNFTAVKTGDCGDANPAVHPGAKESCNGIDDDCDNSTDEEDALGCTQYYYDGDKDGYGTGNEPKCLCATQGQFTSTKNTDCNDANPAVNPGAKEICNGNIDDDCNGVGDVEGTTGCATYYKDEDYDGYGTSGSKCLCIPSAPYQATKSGDCQDNSPSVNPAGKEICNGGIDDDCSGSADVEGTSGCITYHKDEDGDGYGSASSKCLCLPSGAFNVQNSSDCNDGSKSIHPGAYEDCNGVDDNCNGQTDESYPNCDGDSQADCVDADDDNDGVADTKDNCICGKNANQSDIDQDGKGDVCDSDMDGDGAANEKDCCASDASTYPGLADNLWFSQPNKCGKYDYNCDGADSHRWTGIDQCIGSIFGCWGAGSGFWSDDNGIGEPACGVTGWEHTGCICCCSDAHQDVKQECH